MKRSLIAMIIVEAIVLSPSSFVDVGIAEGCARRGNAKVQGQSADLVLNKQPIRRTETGDRNRELEGQSGNVPWSDIVIKWGQFIFTLVIAGATVAYTIGTFGLLKSNRRMIELNQQTLESMRLSFYGSTWQNVVASHRDIFLKVLDSYELLTMMFLRQSDTVDRELTKRERIIGTIVINHAEACFLHLKFQMLPGELKEPIERGLLGLFSNPAIQRIWRSVEPQHRTREFVDFVDQLIQKGRMSGEEIHG